MNERCPEHGGLVRELLLGRLDDRQASDAEETVRSCAVCDRLWQQLHEDNEPLRAAVREGFELAQLPARRRRLAGRWIAAAAAVLLAAAGGVTLLDRTAAPSSEGSEAVVAGVFQGATNGDLNGDGQRDAADIALALQRSGGRS